MQNKELEHRQPVSPRFSTVSDVLSELRLLAHSSGFIYTLARVAAANVFVKLTNDSNWHKRPNIKELTLVLGLVATQPVDTTGAPSEETLNQQIESLHSLLFDLHQIVTQPMHDGTIAMAKRALSATRNESDVPAPEMLVRSPKLVEPIFYWGTGAYDFQYLALVGPKYRYDSDWLATNTGLSTDLLCRTAKELQQLQEQRFCAYLHTTSHEERCQVALATFSFARDDLNFLSDQEFESFIQRFSVTAGQLKQSLTSIADQNQVEYKPIVRIGQDTYFMPVGFNLAQALFESPFFWMQGDKAYTDHAAKHRGMATEEIASHLLERVFSSRVLRNVIVRDGKHDVTEIDVLAFAGNRAVVVQAKSKRLTQPARQGDDNQLRKDFFQAIQEAYDQGIISRRALLNREYTLFDSTGSPIDISEAFEDVHIVCLTLDPFPVLTHRLDHFLTKEPDDPSPIAMSVFDLDIVTTYLPDPFEFLHYTRQRVRWSEQVHGQKEMAFLAWYLSGGLYLPKDVAGAFLTARMPTSIDEDFPAIKGRNLHLEQLIRSDLQLRQLFSFDDNEWPLHAPPSKLPKRWQNSRFNHVIALLKSSPDPGFTEAIFMLYDFSGETADSLIERIEEAKARCLRTKQLMDFSLLFDGFGLTYICFPDHSSDPKLRLLAHVEARKYKSRADKWLGLGGTVSSSTPAEFAVFNLEPWKLDPDLYEMSKVVLQDGIAISPEGKKLGRNQPCWCGSGKKYKKCHI